MKGKKKIIVPLLLASVTASGLVATVEQHQNIQVKAETSSQDKNITGAQLTIEPFAATKYNIGDKVFMPKVKVDNTVDADNIEYVVKKGNKKVEIKTVTAEDLTDASFAGHSVGDKYFVTSYVGYYNISIQEKENGRVVSAINNLSVWVERQDATINLPVNSEYVIPAKIPTSQEGLKIPAPTVTIEENGKDKEKTASELGSALNVYLSTPSEDISLNDKIDSTKTFYAVPADKLAEAGTYSIVYEYKVGDSVISRLESNFQVVSNYKTSDIKLSMSFLDSMPTTGNVNADIKIPKVKVTESSSSTDAINAYVQVIVKNVKTGEKVDVNYTDYTFKPTAEGFYSVTYVASVPLFGADCKTREITPGDVIEIKDRQAPTVIPTYAYDINSTGDVTVVYNKGSQTEGTSVEATDDKTAQEVAEELLVNRKVDIPSVAILKKDPEDSNKKLVEVKVPAAYALDNFYKYKGGDTDDIVITRTYRSASGSVSTVTEPANKVGIAKFRTAGNSEIRYKATDKAGNTLGEIVYDIVVYDIDEDLSKGETKIDLNVGTELVSENEKVLTFAKPTAKDTYDSNVEVRTWYQMVDSSNGNVGEAIELKETNSDGKYEINIEDVIINSEVTAIQIYSKAYVDETLVGTRGTEDGAQLKDNNVVLSKVHTVSILRNDNDHEPAKFTISGTNDWNSELFKINNDIENGGANSIIVKEKAETPRESIGIDDKGYLLVTGDANVNISDTVKLAPFDQGSDIIELPKVVFNDADSNLTIKLSIVDRFGNEVSKDTQETIVRKLNIDEVSYDYTISGAKFKLSSYGLYTVTYTAIDYVGNITIQSFGIRVNDKTAPTITVDDEDKFGKEIEVGEYFRVPTGRLTKNGETINGTPEWEITYASGEYTKQPNGFTPTGEGTFIIRYTAVDENGNPATLEDSMFTITAKDTKAATVVLDMGYRMPSTKKWAPAEGDDYMIIDIPVAIATDKLTKKDLEVVYSVSGPNGTKPTVTDYDDKDNVKYFKATSQGTYTVKYSAVDDAGNESTITQEIKIGDCIKPTLTWNNQDADLPTEVKLNKSYTLDLNKMITLADDGGDTQVSDLLSKLKVTLTGPDGTTVSNNLADGTGYEWSFTKTGNYTLKFVVEDKVGNSNTYTYSITVPSEEAEENKVSPVLGTVLVVLSVVVLAGVVVYFVVSSKKKPGKAKVKKNK